MFKFSLDYQFISNFRDFHADLYPDTAGYSTDLTAAEWMLGKNLPLAKMSLDPAKREKGEEPITVRLLENYLRIKIM